MKHLFLTSVAVLISSLTLDAKSRLGEYYLGFGYTFVDGGPKGDLEGDMLEISANSMASDSTDFIFNLSYANVEQNGTDDSVFQIGLDYVYHYDEYVFQNGMFRPFAGIGLSYLKDDKGVRLGDDGFTWSFLGGTEILFTDSFSFLLGGRFIGLWSDFGENDFSINTGITYWISDVHGIALEYNRAFDQKLDLVGLKYFYSWQ